MTLSFIFQVLVWSI